MNKQLKKWLADTFGKTYYVFRRYSQVDSFSNVEGQVIQEAFALHFVSPFKNKKEANKAIDNAKKMQPWQEFIILRG